MAELTYRDAVARGIAQEMTRDPDVVFLGEDVAKAGGVFKATVGLYEQFGPLRVRDTPISEQAILGAAMGAAMTGLKPIAEIMFSDFFAVCFDHIANEIAKSRYMSNGQLKCPLVIRTGNGAGSRFGAQHSQSVENWCMMIPGLKVVAPSTPRDVVGLLAAAVRDPDPVIFFEHKSLYATKGEVPDGEIVDTLGSAKIVRPGKDATIVALALMVPRALAAAEKLKSEHGIDCEVVDVRSLVPLDTQTILGSVARTHRLFTVEENPRLCGWGAEIVSIVADEAFYDLDGPPVRITTPHVPLPAADFWKTSRCRRWIGSRSGCASHWRVEAACQMRCRASAVTRNPVHLVGSCLFALFARRPAPGLQQPGQSLRLKLIGSRNLYELFCDLADQPVMRIMACDCIDSTCKRRLTDYQSLRKTY